MQTFKKISKIFGIIISIWVIWTFSLFSLIDKTQPNWIDVGWLEILIINIGITFGSIEVLIFNLINYSIILFLIKKNIIKIKEISLFVSIYILTIIFSFSVKAFYLINLEVGLLSYENILSALFLPLIFTILTLNILKFHKRIIN